MKIRMRVGIVLARPYPRNLLAAASILILPGLVGALPSAVYGQGIGKDDGHAGIGGRTVFSAWNLEAGRAIPRDFASYPELLPNLEGWDFRINLPHVRFQRLRAGHASVPVLVGVVEGTPSDGTLDAYGHINNSIWIFQVSEAERAVHFKQLPSRRNRQANTVQNVISLESGWATIQGPPLLRERIAATVLREGLGRATIYVAARDETGLLQYNRLLVTGDPNPVWPSWVPLDERASAPPVLASAFDSLVALAWPRPGSDRIAVRLFSPGTDVWSATVLSVTAAVGRPRLIWDGAALNLFYVEKSNGLLKHIVVRLGDPPTLEAPATVLPLISVKDDDFDVMRFNERLHVVARHDAGAGLPTRLFYSTSTSPFGVPSTWAIPSEVGFAASSDPEIAYLNDNVFVIAIGMDGRVRYARKDPNRLGNDLTGAAFADSWLEPGQRIDNLGSIQELDAISFNSDVYLACLRVPSDDVQAPSSHIMNFSRAAMKRLIARTHRMRMVWGSPGGGNEILPNGTLATFTPGAGRHPLLPQAGESPNVGDFSGDGKDDLVRFAQRSVVGDGPAPVYVAPKGVGNKFTSPTRWHRFFALRDEIPLVGDFNGDRRDDIVTFVQQRQNFSNGTLLGNAPVWVALSDGTRFQRSRVWHKFFSLDGEIPMVGDFNGDGKDDIVTFVQEPQDFADGTPLGSAPVWVALSDGSRFLRSRVWHTGFSFAGEVPMVGDFNGDGRDDIASFVRKPQNENGLLLGNAPVWVALSDGSRFEDARVWHQEFASGTQVPRVGDFDLDGRDDIMSFVNGQSDNEDLASNVYVAFSSGLRFGRATVWHSDLARSHQLPVPGHFTEFSLATITGNPAHTGRRIPGIAVFGRDGDLRVSVALEGVPLQPGAPWEHYKWFTEKSLGIAMFPEWIWDGPGGCLSERYLFALNGVAGSGGATRTTVSVRKGSREGHVLQEVGHSIFDNCFNENSQDPFQLRDAIFGTKSVDGIPGINADAMTFCPSLDDFYNCRDPEHYFLGIMVDYRVSGEKFRNLIDVSTGSVKQVLANQYNWFKTIWYEGVEFRTGPLLDANFAEVGLQLLPSGP
jgi:hypothetical protein